MQRMKRHGSTIRALENGANDASETKSIARTNQFGLTDKQEHFAQCVAKGLTLLDSYKTAYDVGSQSKSTNYTVASKLMDNPKVISRVNTLMEERQKKTKSLDAKFIRQHVFDRLMIESIDEKSSPLARLKALELLGKIDLVSMFSEQRHPTDEKDDPVELQSRLQALLDRMIDVTPKH